MADQNNIQDELRSLNSGLPGSNSQNPFSVPEGYFDGLAASILAKVKGETSSAARELQELSPLLAGIPKEMPFSVPAGYFDENISSLSFLINDEESAVLKALGKEMPYAVPQGYFDELPGRILEKLQPTAKVVPLFARRWMRVAAAAVVGGAMLFGGYRLLNNTDGNEMTAGTFQTPDTTSKLVAKNEKPTVVQDIKKASTEELDAFIKSVPLPTTAIRKETAKPVVKEGEVKELLKNVSVKEIDTFLEQLPTSDEGLATID